MRNEPISQRNARRLLVGFVALGMLVVGLVWATRAEAATITRGGLDYSGVRNPGNCLISDDQGRLDVKCTQAVGATGPAFIRYRFLADVGAVRDHATVSAVIDTWVGKPCKVQWMIPMPKSPARTLRITVPQGSYCDVTSISWSQP